MPKQDHQISRSREQHKNRLETRQNANQDGKAPNDRRKAGKYDERTEAAQPAPAQKRVSHNLESEKLQRAHGKTKEARRNDGVKQQISAGDRNEQKKPRDRDSAELRRQAGKDAKMRRRSRKEDKSSTQAQSRGKDPEKPRHEAPRHEAPRHEAPRHEASHREASKGNEKQNYSAERFDKPFRHYAAIPPLDMPQAAVKLRRAKSSLPASYDAISTQPPQRSNEALKPRRSATVNEELRQPESQGNVRALRLRKLSRVTEMPGSFPAFESMEATELTTMYEIPNEAPVAAAAAEPLRALFHLTGPLINVNVNFNLWGK